MAVEWITGCRCGGATRGGPKCRACDWLQPGGYTHPKTYLSPANCSEYIDLARQAAARVIEPTAAPATTLDKTIDPDKALALLISVATSRERRDIVGYDDRHTQTLKQAMKAIGGREAIAANPAHARAAWPTIWAAALDHIAAKLEAMR